MKEDYFIHKGKKYYSGTVIVVKQFDRCGSCHRNEEATFMYSSHQLNRIAFQLNGCTYNYPKDTFESILVAVTDKIDISAIQKLSSTKRPKTFADELNIDGMLLAWMWYIFIMCAAIIFKDRIAIWTFSSLVFFAHRNKKLRKAGFK